MHELYEQREDYLANALTLSDQEQLAISELNDWLPKNIIDAHAHSNLPEHVESNHMLSTFPSYSLAESKSVHAILHPHKNIRSLRFAKTFKGINHRAANDYLLSESPPEDRVALFGLPEDEEYTISMLAHPRVSGLKMYYSYLNPPAKLIEDIFRPNILLAAEKLGVPIILHTPKMIVESLPDVLQLKKTYPNLKVAIAHLGASKFDVPGLQHAFDRLAQETDFVMDTALNPSSAVCLRAIRTFGPARIMYGSDEPLNLIRSVPYIHPVKGQRIATDYPYHWQDKVEHKEFKHLAQGAIHSHWLSLRALKSAIEELPAAEHEQVKQQVFHDNAAQFYGF
jgi:predicted TIM-barrel fold metal-dependent hydrolase